jgi:hypothetical protein
MLPRLRRMSDRPVGSNMKERTFLGGITLKTMPSEKGSKLSTSSSSALPPIVIIWYISLSFRLI